MKTFAMSAQLCILALGIEPLVTGQTTINGSRVMMGSWNAAGATHTLPSKTGLTAQLPSTCTQGEEYFATDATAGQNKYYCASANTWTQQSAFLRTSTFANLGAAVNGSILYCSNCAQTTPCTAGGTGAVATALNAAWSCSGGGAGATYTFRDDLTNTSNTVDFNPFDTGLFLIEEFMPNNRAAAGTYAVGALGWGVACVGGTSCFAGDFTDPGGHPGIFRISGGNGTAGMGAALTLADVYDTPSGTMPIANMGTGGSFTYWETQAIVETDLNNATFSKYLVGFTDNTNTYHPSSGNEIAVRYDTAGGGCTSGESTVDWVYEVIVAGTQYCLDSGVAVAAATWYKIRIYSSTPGTINFQIGVSAGAFGGSASIAHAPTATLTPNFMSINVSTGAYHYLYIDRWAIKIRGINR
jgi:hypothetical protein